MADTSKQGPTQPDGTKAPGRSANTTASRGNQARPRLPHERDQSSDSQADDAPVDDGRARQAHDDVERGAVDTDKGPVIDRTYERVKNDPAP